MNLYILFIYMCLYEKVSMYVCVHVCVLRSISCFESNEKEKCQMAQEHLLLMTNVSNSQFMAIFTRLQCGT